MSARKILFLIAGLIDTIAGALIGLLSLIVLVAKNLIKQMFETSFDLVKEFIESMASADPKYEYLRSLSNTEAVNYIMDIVTGLALFAFVAALLFILFGVLNLVLVKKCDILISTKKSAGVLLIVFSWLLLTLNIANIFSTIAVVLCFKNKNTSPPLYSVENKNNEVK